VHSLFIFEIYLYSKRRS